MNARFARNNESPSFLPVLVVAAIQIPFFLFTLVYDKYKYRLTSSWGYTTHGIGDPQTKVARG